MALADDINRVWRDFVRYTGDGKPGAPSGRPLPHGDPASGEHSPGKGEIRNLLILIAQTMGDPSALQSILDQMAGKADLESSGKIFASREAAIAVGQAGIPGQLRRIITIEGDEIVFRGNESTSGALFGSGPWWGVVARLPAKALLDAEAQAREAGDASAIRRANHTGVQPITTIDGLSASLAGLSAARADGDAAETQARALAIADVNRRAVPLFESRTAAVEAAASLPIDVAFIQVREGTSFVLRSRATAPGANPVDPLYPAGWRWGVILRQDVQAEAQARALAVDRLELNDIERPGENRSRWSSTATGRPEDRPALSVGAEVNGPYGAALRISGGDVPAGPGYLDLAPRRAYALDPGRIYQLRVAVARVADSADPLGDAIELRAQNLNANKSHVSNVRLGDPIQPTVAQGIVETVFTISRDDISAGYLTPGSARYFTPVIRIYGVGQTTDVLYAYWRDVTDVIREGEQFEGSVEQERAARREGDAATLKQALSATAVTLINIGGTGDAITAELSEAAAAAGVSTIPIGGEFRFRAEAANGAENPTITVGDITLGLRSANGSAWPAAGLQPGRWYQMIRYGSTTARMLTADVERADLQAEAAQRSAQIADEVDKIHEMIEVSEGFQSDDLVTFKAADDAVFGKVAKDGAWDIVLRSLVTRDGMEVTTFERNGSDGFAFTDAAGGILPSLIETPSTPTPDPEQALPVHTFGRETLRQLRYRLTGRRRGLNLQCNVAAIGDSYTQSSARWSGPTAEMLAEKYGDGGGGWTGYGYFGAYSGPYAAGGAQPAGPNGNARPALYPVVYTGAWQRTYNGSPSPDLSHVTSSTAGDRITATVPAAPDHTGLRLVWIATADGVVRHRVDGGAWTTLPVQGTVGTIQSAIISLTPGAHSVDIEVVSGTVNLCGHDALSAAPGVRFHKLAGSGALLSQWAAQTAAQQQAGWALLGLHAAVIMDGTNSQNGAVPAATWRGQMLTVINRLRAAIGQPDIAIVMPPENQRPANPVPMAAYTAEALALAREVGAAFRDLQPDFGRAPVDYAAGSAFPMFNADGIHPEPATGGVLMTGALFDFLDTL